MWVKSKKKISSMIRSTESSIDMIKEKKFVAMLNSLHYFYQSSILHREFMIKRVHGNKMYLNLQGRDGVSRALAIYGTREELETEVIKRELQKGMVVLDIGANIGYYALIEASIVSKSGKVYAVEPYPPSYKSLKKNVELNQYSDIIEAKQVAISDKTGISRLYIGKTDNLNTLIDSNEYAEREYIETETIAIDDFLKDKPKVDFIRMDIEGAERQVIGRLIDTIDNGKPPKILFETHPTGDVDPDPKFTPLVEKIIDFGYRPKTIISSSNEKSLKIFAELGYESKKIMKGGNSIRGLFEDIAAEDLIKVAFRRPKATRAILLVHQQL